MLSGRNLAVSAACLFLPSAFAFGQPAGPSDRTILSDASFTVKLDWFDGAACAGRDKKLFYFRVGNQVFVAPVGDVGRGVLKRINRATQSPSGEMKVNVPATAGCKSNPLPFVQVELKNDPAVPSFILLTETAERTDAAPPVARYIQHLSQTGACRAANQPSLIACAGSRTDGGKTFNIVFLVVSEGGNRVDVPASGTPIHARCEGTSEIVGCFVSEELENGVSAKTAIDPKHASAREIRQLRQQLVDFAAKRRANSP